MSCNPRMHMGICMIPICTWGSWRSQYACGDSMTHNPHVHTGIKINLCMHTGIAQIPVCIQGLHENHRMHMGIARHVIPVCIQGLILIPICKWGSERSPYTYGDRMDTNPCMHTGFGRHCMHMGIFESLTTYGKYFHMGY